MMISTASAASYELSTNNVGINTASPTSVLAVGGNVAIGGVAYTSASNPPANGLIVQGNVGVGSVTPGQTLDVQGTVRTLGFNIIAGAGVGKVLTSDSSGNGTWNTVSGVGTVTSTSVVSANGFTGTVATATSTPAITIATSITGLLKGNGTAISAASSGTDFAPATSGGSILFGNGAGGFSNVSIGTGMAFSGGNLSTTVTTQTGANPSATIGLSGLNGSSGNFMRADAAPALSQAITPTWTNLHNFTASPFSAIFSNNVGIGSSSPGALLDVQGTVRVVTLTGGTGSATLIGLAGNWGIGSTNPGQTLDVNGTIRNSGSMFNTGITSDATKTDATMCEDSTTHQFYSGSGTLGICLGTSTMMAKQNIMPISEGIAQIMALKPVSFNYRPGWGFDPKKPYYGFLAEDVDHVLPRLVGRNSHGVVRNADYVGMIPITVKAIQQLQIEQLKRERHQNKFDLVLSAIVFCITVYLFFRKP